MGGEETTPGRAGSARSHSPGYLQTQVEGDFLWKEKMVSYPWRRCLCFPPFCAHHEPHQQPQTPQAVGKPGITGQPFLLFLSSLLPSSPGSPFPSTVCRVQREHCTKVSRANPSPEPSSRLLSQ